MKKIDPVCHDGLVKRLASNQNDGLNIDYNNYTTCYEKQWSALVDNKNDKGHSFEKTGSYLDRDYEARFNVGFSFHPSIAVNNITFRGDVKDVDNFFKAVCSTLRPRPDECRVLKAFGD
jgi:hypothetical protein